MLRIWHAPRTRSVRIVWLAEELGIPYEIRPSRLAERSPELKAVSPLSQLPAIEDDGLVMVESVAIMQYLAEKHGPTPLVVSPSEPDFPHFLQFLHHGEATLLGLSTAVIATMFFAPDDQKDNWTANYARAATVKRTRLSALRLADREYLAGDRFTIADISVGYGLDMLQSVGIVPNLEEPLASYVLRLKARPGYQQAFSPVT